ncbi:initiation factor 2 [Hypomontagnella monticulosa]|nr:initiation factor 2 [Hypomontagnella monticulosa]
MLRASVSKREPSICAFCQYRLSLRLAPRSKRQFSSTKTLGADGGWGSWGTQAKPQTQRSQDDFLSQHELLARKQLLANQQAQTSPEPPRPKPGDNGLRSRYVWDATKQKEVEEGLRRDGISFPKTAPPIGRRGGGSDAPARPFPPPKPFDVVERLRGRQPFGGVHVNPFEKTLGQLGSNESTTKTGDTRNQSTSKPTRQNIASEGGPVADIAPSSNNSASSVGRIGSDRKVDGRSNVEGKDQSQKTKDDTSSARANLVDQLSVPVSKKTSNKPPLRDNTIYSSRDSESSSAPTTRTESKRAGATIDNTIRPAQGSGGNSDWGLLARKKAPGKSNSEDFWATMNNNSNIFRKTVPRKPEVSEQPLRRHKAITDFDAMDAALDASDPKTSSYDWGEEYDKTRPRRVQQSKPSPSEDVTKRAPEGQGQARSSKGRDRDRGRDRFGDRSVEEEQGRGGGGRGKRSRRNTGFRNDAEEDGFDYDQYQEKRRIKAQRKAQREAGKRTATPIRLPELISIPALAEALKVEPNLFLSQLGELGFEGVTLDSLMAGETAALVAQEYGFEPTVEEGGDRDLKPRPPPEDPSILPPRPPVVTIMGHVDHGKTTLLDYLRKSSIAAQEHGGITQRIGAFSVKLSSGKPITFLDTPGHAAFLTMRQRGAYVTDIVVLVVAADDSVKPQTIEAIKHARGAKVPMIVAINKIDKEGARIDQVKHDLSVEGVEIEDFGGDVQVVCVSGKTGQGMDDLEENILTLSEILDHRAEVDGPAEGWVLESSLKPIGKAATVLVKRGTLRPGDYIAAGLTWGKIRSLRNEAGVAIDEAPPGTPVEILGWKDLPAAGDQVLQAPDEGRAKDAVTYREGLAEREKDAAAQEVISEARRALQEKRAREKAASNNKEAPEPLPEEENGAKLVNFVVKGDLHGSVEAVCGAIQELGNHEVRPRILRSGTGPIHEFDVEHAAMSQSVIVNFATMTPGYIRQMAEEQGVKILDHNVIYHLVDDVKANLSSYLAPEITSRVLGEAEVLQIFPINIKGRQYKNIAGCRVRNGMVARGNLFRVYRDGEKIFDGKLETLKHLKKDVTEVRKGTECGIGFEEFQDFEVGDQIQAYEEVSTARSL